MATSYLSGSYTPYEQNPYDGPTAQDLANGYTGSYTGGSVTNAALQPTSATGSSGNTFADTMAQWSDILNAPTTPTPAPTSYLDPIYYQVPQLGGVGDVPKPTLYGTGDSFTPTLGGVGDAMPPMAWPGSPGPNRPVAEVGPYPDPYTPASGAGAGAGDQAPTAWWNLGIVNPDGTVSRAPMPTGDSTGNVAPPPTWPSGPGWDDGSNGQIPPEGARRANGEVYLGGRWVAPNTAADTIGAPDNGLPKIYPTSGGTATGGAGGEPVPQLYGAPARNSFPYQSPEPNYGATSGYLNEYAPPDTSGIDPFDPRNAIITPISPPVDNGLPKVYPTSGGAGGYGNGEEVTRTYMTPITPPVDNGLPKIYPTSGTTPQQGDRNAQGQVYYNGQWVTPQLYGAPATMNPDLNPDAGGGGGGTYSGGTATGGSGTSTTPTLSGTGDYTSGWDWGIGDANGPGTLPPGTTTTTGSKPRGVTGVGAPGGTVATPTEPTVTPLGDPVLPPTTTADDPYANTNWGSGPRQYIDESTWDPNAPLVNRDINGNETTGPAVQGGAGGAGNGLNGEANPFGQQYLDALNASLEQPFNKGLNDALRKFAAQQSGGLAMDSGAYGPALADLVQNAYNAKSNAIASNMYNASESAQERMLKLLTSREDLANRLKLGNLQKEATLGAAGLSAGAATAAASLGLQGVLAGIEQRDRGDVLNYNLGLYGIGRDLYGIDTTNQLNWAKLLQSLGPEQLAQMYLGGASQFPQLPFIT